MSASVTASSPRHHELEESVERLFKVVEKRADGAELLDLVVNQLEAFEERRHGGGVSITQDQIDFMVGDDPSARAEYAAAARDVADGSYARGIDAHAMREAVATLSTSQVAERLGIDESRVRHRQAGKQLYSYLIGKNRRYPDWQFDTRSQGTVIPGLAQIIAEIPDGAHPLTVRGLMTTPQDELLISDSQVNAVDWLVSGGDKQHVVAVFRGHFTQ